MPLKCIYQNSLKGMRYKLVFLLFTLLFFCRAYATHNRAGEITLTQTGTLTYEIEIKTFTYSLSPADRSELEVQWGDNTTSIAPRKKKMVLPNLYYENHYYASHTYPGPGTYTVIVQDPNRNYGVLNIPNSVNVIFSIKTIITINPSIGTNSTPVLLNPPIDRAAYRHRFVHNPAAYDPDGDSISYALTVCTEENGQPIAGYELPPASDTLYIDGSTGDLVWDAPVDTGIYNIAIKINEWRKGVIIGSINRDMQINVYNTDNNPPVNMPMGYFCIEAGKLFEYDITSTDPDSDYVKQIASGGPFVQEDSPATFDIILTGPGISISRFSWQTNCSHVRNQPYSIIIKAEDKNPDISLVDIDNFFIKVIGPPPENLITVPSSKTIRLYWDQYTCQNIKGYRIYRKDGHSDFSPDSCLTGVPSLTGYSFIGSAGNRADTMFNDTNDGNGLSQGIEYCYIITALFADGTESYASTEACGTLIPGKPAMLNVSVTKVAEDGEIFLSWAKPKELESIVTSGQYKYMIYRYNDMWGDHLVRVDSFATGDLNDTTYLDHVNTTVFPYSYRVELYYKDVLGNYVRLGEGETVSSTFLDVTGADNENILHIRKNVPWIMDSCIIYRQNRVTMMFDSIGTTDSDSFSDHYLENGREYCYQVKCFGRRIIYNSKYENENLSHIGCGTPIDTTPPCPPVLIVNQLCDSMRNELVWTNPNNSCANDVIRYRIYFTPKLDATPELFDSTMSPTDTSAVHFPSASLAGCYAVTAVDSFFNESNFSEIYCVPKCLKFELPNVFSPNGDGINDYYKSRNFGVDKVDMKIYNRWGYLVFKTGNPDINWDGKHMNTNTLVSPGVYYYICDIYQTGLSGDIITNKVGFVYVYTQPGAANPPEK